MYSLKLRFFIAFNLFFSLVKIESASSQEQLATDIFEPAPAVWRSIANTHYYETQVVLRRAVMSSPLCGKHNRVQSVLHIETDNGTNTSIELDRIFKSNHAYSQEGGTEYDKETLEGQCSKTKREFKESSTQVVSESDNSIVLQILGRVINCVDKK